MGNERGAWTRVGNVPAVLIGVMLSNDWGRGKEGRQEARRGGQRAEWKQSGRATLLVKCLDSEQ